jgi:hypothetical protein
MESNHILLQEARQPGYPEQKDYSSFFINDSDAREKR